MVTDNIKIQPLIVDAIHAVPSNKALIILYGNANKGKTSTLFQLLSLIGNKSSSILKTAIATFIQGKMKMKPNKGCYYGDARIVITYCGIQIAIATYGDNQKNCEDNMSFFRQEKRGNVPFYFFDGTKFVNSSSKNLTINQRKFLETIHPTIFISACHEDGITLEVMKYCSDHYRRNIDLIMWVHKEGLPPTKKSDFCTNNLRYANDLMDAIDRIANGHIL